MSKETKNKLSSNILEDKIIEAAQKLNTIHELISFRQVAEDARMMLREKEMFNDKLIEKLDSLVEDTRITDEDEKRLCENHKADLREYNSRLKGIVKMLEQEEQETPKKPKEPRVGALCRFWDVQNDRPKVGTLTNTCDTPYKYQGDGLAYWVHCEELTPEEAYDIIAVNVQEEERE